MSDTPWWWEGYRDAPDVHELERECPVCDKPVYDDPQHQRDDHTSPVRTRDRRYTHAGCQGDYEHVVARLEAADGAEPAAEPVEYCRDSRHGDYTQRQRTA
jgi:hypothetical protein